MIKIMVGDIATINDSTPQFMRADGWVLGCAQLDDDKVSIHNDLTDYTGVSIVNILYSCRQRDPEIVAVIVCVRTNWYANKDGTVDYLPHYGSDEHEFLAGEIVVFASDTPVMTEDNKPHYDAQCWEYIYMHSNGDQRISLN